ncbi:hypothetical protein HYH03_000848 [Edaphochlamys debaryana]|uniref:Uncharacterized protein n=1 Tax=Edaphochlamys debaryana TaxID=47281 RepID=A0A835YFX9_9CHLO|nr:hypothetical protein HYH03_000848 [Edaphochlamys debaryana]|eukprot:KAG2501029.1 hypothetical protein HYH03_000848 [Edaphochlamys debaryana]
MYCGCGTKVAVAVWIVFTACFVSGCIWLPIGGVTYGSCGFCWDKYQENRPGPVLYNVNITAADDDIKGCSAWAYEFALINPDDSVKMDARDYFWWWCVNDGSGAIAMMIAGGSVLGFSLILLVYFLIAKPPIGEKIAASKA